jgi:hypothetical protein
MNKTECNQKEMDQGPFQMIDRLPKPLAKDPCAASS